MPGEISRTYDPFPYDPKAYELAEHYLQDEPCTSDPALYKQHCISLARAIQRAAEDWFILEPAESQS